jgi:hypothetical protein
MLTLADVPCTMLVGVTVNVVVVGLNVTEFHWLTRFAILTDPSPVVWS